MTDRIEPRSGAGDPQPAAACDCPLANAGRRRFLRDVGAMVAAVLAVGAVASPAAALVNAVTEVGPTNAAGPLRTYSLPSTDSISLDVANDVILARWQDRVHAFSLKCPHRGARLEWHEDEQRIFCPKHKARFTADGTHDSGRGSRDLDRYRLSRQAGSIVVDLATVLRADSDPDAWRAAVIDV
jgi:nitrite reductase/ring-hydroxylating ferredoxin subunit